MIDLSSQFSIRVNERVFLKNPDSTTLGRNLISGSIALIDEMGFEHFTFRKLAGSIDSTEASVYRYFENKHRLLIYLLTLYWGRMEFALMYQIANVTDSREQLRRAIYLLTGATATEGIQGDIDAVRLQRIVIAESPKAYLTKEVDLENREGFFRPYKQLVARIADIIHAINPAYKYPHMLVSTVIEGVYHQRFFADHLPRLTDQVQGEDSVTQFYEELVFHAISDAS